MIIGYLDPKGLSMGGLDFGFRVKGLGFRG